MIIKFKNGSTIKTIEDNNAIRGQRAKIKGIDKLYGFKFRWYQKLYLRLYLRFFDTKLMKWFYRFKRYDR